jgi:hypothetical protein
MATYAKKSHTCVSFMIRVFLFYLNIIYLKLCKGEMYQISFPKSICFLFQIKLLLVITQFIIIQSSSEIHILFQYTRILGRFGISFVVYQ